MNKGRKGVPHLYPHGLVVVPFTFTDRVLIPPELKRRLSAQRTQRVAHNKAAQHAVRIHSTRTVRWLPATRDPGVVRLAVDERWVHV